jgi:uncharacterized surface protein with fasciclin (FAS1) repeats
LFIKQQTVMNQRIFLLAVVTALSVSLISCSDSGSSTTGSADSAGTTDNMSTDNMASTDTTNNTSTEQGVMVGGANMVPSKNIVENASASSEHTTLVTAVKAAGLVETLSGTGPFTVFAPTNAAFDKLPAGTVDKLVTPAMKSDLTNILTYHVVAGSMRAADLKDGQKLKTVQGKELTVSMKDGKVMIDGATVTTPDVISSNGVTHVIDAVVMPKK